MTGDRGCESHLVAKLFGRKRGGAVGVVGIAGILIVRVVYTSCILKENYEPIVLLRRFFRTLFGFVFRGILRITSRRSMVPIDFIVFDQLRFYDQSL